LLDAIRLLGVRKVRVVLCGRGRVDRALLAHYADLALDIKIAVTRAQLVRELHASDVLVLPSLVEGFAHVILEAMACGVPVVTTHHTCAPDVMVDGEHGFIVPVGDAGAIADRIAWGLDHRSDLAGMGVAASRQASEFTWARFRQGIRDAYVQMLMAAA
jgi:glycosyltransferase involved in cell wall biosynthesis